MHTHSHNRVTPNVACSVTTKFLFLFCSFVRNIFTEIPQKASVAEAAFAAAAQKKVLFRQLQLS